VLYYVYVTLCYVRSVKLCYMLYCAVSVGVVSASCNVTLCYTMFMLRYVMFGLLSYDML